MQTQKIKSKIYEVREQKVMLDYDLAHLYRVETKALNQAVKRNIKRFPPDFMFRLTQREWTSMRSQFVTASAVKKNMRSQIVTASQNKRNDSFTPYAFTEQGLAMLSGILNSEKAIQVNIEIMRAFVLIRRYALSYKELTGKLKELETRYNKKFNDIDEALVYLLRKDKQETLQRDRKRIGYK